MTPEELEFYKQKLMKKREEILSRLEKHSSAQNQEKDEGQEDMADRALQTYQKEYIYYLTDSEQFILDLITESLDRIASGSFGFCVACFGAIQKKRLEAVPWARHCIHCQELQDQGLL
ncbi:MAG: hypothetical protein A2Y62_20980 [Candidatus Fischerbacteria bacterium RBG_13_37_8]|uniref:Zinc finger DksA/TraR C4-type domain-containing protein n=1 Tax=Candidatus Fischerbacteria bacterium RBG_13_37_8 TaxID=1817863 RepID=A0A1F5VV90_9BACT|nr:MAG: hypothetical protein A2Y62_20980 [Candidatus Fischerbacteria bacterium RBG_13_37_8]